MKFVNKIIDEITSKINSESLTIRERCNTLLESICFIKDKVNIMLPAIRENNRKDAIIEEQAKTISLLLGNIGDFHDTQMFIYQSYRGAPVAYVNGERVDREKMKSMTVWWSAGEYPSVEVE